MSMLASCSWFQNDTAAAVLVSICSGAPYGCESIADDKGAVLQ